MFPSLRAAPWRLQRNRRFDLMQWCFPTAWPNASPQDNCHSLSLKCRYKTLCLSQLHFSLTSCAWVLNTENPQSCLWIITCVPTAGESQAPSTTSPCSGKSLTLPNKKLLLDLGRGTQPILEAVFNLNIHVTIVLVDTSSAILKQSPLGEKSITKMWSKTFSYATNKKW